MAVLLPGASWLPVTLAVALVLLSQRQIRHSLLLRLRWSCAWRSAALHVFAGRVPHVISIRTVPVGDELLVRVRPGVRIEALAARAPALASALRVGEVRIRPVPGNASHARVLLVRADPMRAPVAPAWPQRTALEAPLQDGVSVAVDRDGLPVVLDVRKQLLLEGQEEGVFAALSLVLAAAALDPEVELMLLDGEEVALAPWHDLALRVDYANPNHARHLLLELREELDVRKREILRQRTLRLDPQPGYPLVLLVVHQLDAYIESAAASDLVPILRALIVGGRRTGIVVVLTGADLPKELREVMPARWTFSRSRVSRLDQHGHASLEVRCYGLDQADLLDLLDQARLARAVRSELATTAYVLERNAPCTSSSLISTPSHGA